MIEPSFWAVALDVPEAESDDRGASLFDLGATGVELRDGTTLAKSVRAGEVTLVASFESQEAARRAKATLDAIVPRANARVQLARGDAWRDEYKKYFHPFELCKGVVVRPPWEEHVARPGDAVLVLEPGRAFGTGLHETTSLVAQALSARRAELSGREVLDVGCGSGILSLAALALGARHAHAIDVDADAVAVARENAERNDMQPRLEADTTGVGAIDRAYFIVLANIEASVLEPMAAELSARVAPGGLLILSGVLAPQTGRIRACYMQFDLEETLARGEWVALVLRRRS